MRKVLVQTARATRPVLRPVVRPLARSYRLARSSIAGWTGATSSHCPSCGFFGPFVPGGGHLRRPYALCPKCGAAERHRLVRAACATQLPAKVRTCLHFAPEPQLTSFFSGLSDVYVTADVRAGFDLRLDLTSLGLRSSSVDLVVAIHVLEHIRDDEQALGELARIVAPGGTAVIAVPTVADTTVEYRTPNPFEHGHVRAPGVDWYSRLDPHFRRVDLISSEDLPDEYQTRVWEDRSRFPTVMAPERPPQTGPFHDDYVAFARA